MRGAAWRPNLGTDWIIWGHWKLQVVFRLFMLGLAHAAPILCSYTYIKYNNNNIKNNNKKNLPP